MPRRQPTGTLRQHYKTIDEYNVDRDRLEDAWLFEEQPRQQHMVTLFADAIPVARTC